MQVGHLLRNLSSDQVIELREHHVTPALYYTPPTVSAYTDREDLLARLDGLRVVKDDENQDVCRVCRM